MSIIATLLPQPLFMQRLHAAIRDRHSLRECPDWLSLSRVCDREPVRVAVIDLYAAGAPDFVAIRQLKFRLPRLALVAYVAMAPDRAHSLFEAGKAGIDGLVLAEQNDAPRDLLATIEASDARSIAGLVRRSLDGVEAGVADAVLLSVTRAEECLSPDAFARLLAQPRRAVTERLVAAGFPPPQRLLTWGRLIVAAHMLEDEHRSADRVATTLGFPSGSAFRNTCQRYVHATPGQIRAQGGAAHVVRTLVRQVRGRGSGVSGSPSAARMPTVAL